MPTISRTRVKTPLTKRRAFGSFVGNSSLNEVRVIELKRQLQFAQRDRANSVRELQHMLQLMAIGSFGGDDALATEICSTFSKCFDSGFWSAAPKAENSAQLLHELAALETKLQRTEHPTLVSGYLELCQTWKTKLITEVGVAQFKRQASLNPQEQQEQQQQQQQQQKQQAPNPNPAIGTPALRGRPAPRAAEEEQQQQQEEEEGAEDDVKAISPLTGGIVELRGGQHFTELVHNQQGLTVCAFFSANWCGSCRRLTPAYEALAASSLSKKVLFVKLHSQDGAHAKIFQQQQVDVLPTLILYKGGTPQEVLIAPSSTLLESTLKAVVQLTVVTKISPPPPVQTPLKEDLPMLLQTLARQGSMKPETVEQTERLPGVEPHLLKAMSVAEDMLPEGNPGQDLSRHMSLVVDDSYLDRRMSVSIDESPAVSPRVSAAAHLSRRDRSMHRMRSSSPSSRRQHGGIAKERSRYLERSGSIENGRALAQSVAPEQREAKTHRRRHLSFASPKHEQGGQSTSGDFSYKFDFADAFLNTDREETAADSLPTVDSWSAQQQGPVVLGLPNAPKMSLVVNVKVVGSNVPLRKEIPTQKTLHHWFKAMSKELQVPIPHLKFRTNTGVVLRSYHTPRQLLKDNDWIIIERIR